MLRFPTQDDSITTDKKQAEEIHYTKTNPDLKDEEGWEKIPFLLEKIINRFTKIIYPTADARYKELLEEKALTDDDRRAWKFIQRLSMKIEADEQFNPFIRNQNSDITIKSSADPILDKCAYAASFLSNVRDWVLLIMEYFENNQKEIYEEYKINSHSDNALRVEEAKKLINTFTFACPRLIGTDIDKIGKWANAVFEAIPTIEGEAYYLIATFNKNLKTAIAHSCVTFERGVLQKQASKTHIGKLSKDLRGIIYQFLYPSTSPQSKSKIFLDMIFAQARFPIAHLPGSMVSFERGADQKASLVSKLPQSAREAVYTFLCASSQQKKQQRFSRILFFKARHPKLPPNELKQLALKSIGLGIVSIQEAIQRYTDGKEKISFFGLYLLYQFASQESFHIAKILGDYFFGKKAHSPNTLTQEKEEAKEIIDKLELDPAGHLKTKIENLDPLTDEERLDIAIRFIQKYPKKSFARELTKISEIDEYLKLEKLVQNERLRFLPGR